MHLEDPDTFIDRDPHLKQLQKQSLIHRSRLLEKLPRRHPGIYSIGGARQVGKTTLMKQWMADLLHDNADPERISYLTGELIDDHHTLVRIVTETLNLPPDTGLHYLLIDEVTYIRDWDRGIKFLSDAGIFENVIVVLSGSDLSIIKEARMKFPGRRGAADVVDFHLYPLDFRETVKLKKVINRAEIDRLLRPGFAPEPTTLDALYHAFNDYLIHGGFLTAINALAENGHIPVAVFSTYSDWIRGDVLKRGKQEHYLREILNAVVNRYGSQITWNALAQDLSIDHPKTIADYVALLESMDALFIQYALSENTLSAFPKKARKLIFTDPFIYHATRAWLSPVKDPYHMLVLAALADSISLSRLVEACAASLYRRHFPTFYIKSQGEVDIACVDGRGFMPLEIKWTEQIRPKDLKQIAKYPNGRILGKSRQYGEILGVPTEPLPLALLRLGV